MITYDYEELFRQDSVKKNWLIVGDDIMLSNTELYQESVEISESLCTDSNVIFGSCVASSLKFTTSAIDSEFLGKELLVTVYVNDNETPFTVGTYTVAEETLTADRSKKEIVAYDALYNIINTDVAEWFNGLTFPLTVAEFRTLLFNNFSIEQETITLVNDSLSIASKPMDVNTLSGTEVLKAICEINGVFGHINRNNIFEYKSLGTTSVYDVLPSMYSECKYEDYTVQKITKLQMRQSGDDIGVIVGSGDNTYIVEDNFLVYGLGTSAMTTVANTLLNKIKNIEYIPTDIDCIGNPCVEVGDRITLRNKEGGRNLIEYPWYHQSGRRSAGVEWTVGDDLKTLSAYRYATSTSDSAFYCRDFDDLILPNGNYRLTGCPSGGSGSSYYIRVYRNWVHNNLIPYPYYNGDSKTHRGVTFTCPEEGYIYLNNTNSGAGTSIYVLMNYNSEGSANFIKGNTAYTYSIDRDDDRIYAFIYFKDSENNNISVHYTATYEDGSTVDTTNYYISLVNNNIYHTSITFTVDSTASYYAQLDLRVASGSGTYENAKARLMLRLASDTDSEWVHHKEDLGVVADYGSGRNFSNTDGATYTRIRACVCSGYSGDDLVFTPELYYTSEWRDTYVLNRKLTGIQALKDNYTAEGDETYPDNVNGVQLEIKQLRGKSNVLTRTIEQTQQTITDVEEGLQTQITQTASEINLNLSNNYSTTSEMNNAINNSASGTLQTVSQTYETKDDANTNYGNLSTEIQTTAEGIESRVSTTYERSADAEYEYSDIRSSITQLSDRITAQLEEIQSEIDGEYETYERDSGEPTLLNYPYWDFCTNIPVREVNPIQTTNDLHFEYTENDRSMHALDLCIVIDENKSYRFQKIENVWSWRIIADSDLNYVLQKVTTLEATTDGISTNVSNLTATVDGQALTLTRHESQITQQASEISAKVSQTGGDSSSFGWSLTSNKFELKSSGSTVFKCTSSGIEVSGKIVGTSGSIGGWTIASNKLSAGNVSINSNGDILCQISGDTKWAIKNDGTASFKNLTLTGYATTAQLNAQTARIDTISSNYVTANQLSAVDAKFSTLNANNITAGTINTARLNIDGIVSGMSAKNLTVVGLSITGGGFSFGGDQVQWKTVGGVRVLAQKT